MSYRNHVIDSPALKDEDRKSIERFTQVAAQLGLTIY
jgi:hypothetical protein